MVNLVSTVRPDGADKLEKEVELGLVRAWSFSALSVFEDCPYRTYISRVKRIREPSGAAAERGTMIHDAAEHFVCGKRDDLIKELADFKEDFEELRKLYIAGKAEVEGEWGFNIDWEPTGWMADDIWARIKLDVMVHESETSGRVIDHKSGKKWGNEIKHGQQALLYAIAAFLKFPNMELITTELWYIDQDEKTIKVFTRDQAMEFLAPFHKRGINMTTAKEFDPKPSKGACRWCSFKEGEYPECKWGIK